MDTTQLIHCSPMFWGRNGSERSTAILDPEGGESQRAVAGWHEHERSHLCLAQCASGAPVSSGGRRDCRSVEVAWPFAPLLVLDPKVDNRMVGAYKGLGDQVLCTTAGRGSQGRRQDGGGMKGVDLGAMANFSKC